MRHLMHMTAPGWLVLYASILAAWAALWLAAADPAAVDAPLAWLAEICRAAPTAQGWPGLFAMWLLMSAAMMLPTALPAFATYDQVADAHGLGGGGALVAGYAAVWAGFSGLAALAQVALAATGLLDAAGRAVPALGATLLILAAVWQVTPWKAACLTRCRQPLTFFMERWDDGPWRMGLRLGAVCLGCCWALMLLAFAGGVMSLGFMALATILMTAEKLSASDRLTHSIALGCLAAAGYLIGGYV